MKTKILIILIALISLGVGGFLIYEKVVPPSYSYVLAEFIQKQQTLSPYTKYEPSFTIDRERQKIYYVFKAMDDNDIWQIWSASSDLDGNNWQETKQTDSPENKQRPAIIFDQKDDLIYYFYRTGNETGASERITRRLVMATKKPNEEKWRQEKELVGDDGIDDTISVALDSSRRLIIFTYTKDNQVVTAFLNLDNGEFKKTIHTQTEEMNFLPNLTYEESNGIAYIVFPRARAQQNFEQKDLWLARVYSDGSGYEERRLTQTENDNTWPFVTLDLARQKLYVSYSFFGAKPTYSLQGIPRVKEEIKIGRANLDGTGWENLGKGGLRIFGIDKQNGFLYGIYQEPKKNLEQNEKAVRYFAVYDPNKNKLEKQFIPSGDELTYYDAISQKFDDETNRLFGAQQVCRFTGERGIECQIWTYTGRLLKGKKPTLPVQKSAEMAPPQFRQLPEFKIISIQTVSNKIKINTNRKVSMPVEIKVTSNGQEIKWEPRQLSQIDQDKGIELRFDNPLSSYEVSYKICALGDTTASRCKEGTTSYSGQEWLTQTFPSGVFEGEDFRITIPEGWVGTTQLTGTLLTIVKPDETHPDDPAVQSLNFKSYITVLLDKTEGMSVSQLGEAYKDTLIASIPGSSVTGFSDDVINNLPAKIYELDIPQQGINFKLVSEVVAKGDKVFIISLNTTPSKLPIYKNSFYQTAQTFEFKY